MRSINLKGYEVKIFDSDGISTNKTYDVRDAIVSILMSQHLNLGASQLLKNGKIGDRILDIKKDEIILEETEWEVIRDAVNKVVGFTRNDREMVQRILEAPCVEVATVQPSSPQAKKADNE